MKTLMFGFSNQDHYKIVNQAVYNKKNKQIVLTILHSLLRISTSIWNTNVKFVNKIIVLSGD